MKDGFITGLGIQPTSNADVLCESCIYAKATCKLVLKAREGKCAAKFSDEIHTNVWGLAPVKFKGGKCYYITYMDDRQYSFYKPIPLSQEKQCL